MVPPPAICALILLLSLFINPISTEALSTEDTTILSMSPVKKTTPLLLSVNETLEHTKISAPTTYNKIRIAANYDNLNQGTLQFINYVKKELLPAVIDYFQAALRIRQPLTTSLKLPTSVTTACGLKVPKSLYDGVQTDFYLIVSSTSDATSSWVASAGICFTSSASKRPLIAHMIYNIRNAQLANGDPLTHEKNIYLTIHEMFHALGFISTSFPDFIDDNGNTRKGHIKNISLEGKVRTVLDIEPLTTKLRLYSGCSSLPGAFMENDGDSGTIGSHFEKRQFLYEVMTSGVVPGLKVSEFSLAVLEGSGWYKPDYNYAEPFFAGAGEGCGFLYTSCKLKNIMSYSDFCQTDGARGCGLAGNIGGICSSDSRSDGCMYYKQIIQYSCENPAASSYARFPSKEVFSRTEGSKCFTGNLTAKAQDSQTTFCFKYKCSGTGTATNLLVYIGSLSVTCKSAGPLKVNGFNGNLNCPDPLTFCNTIGRSYCPRNCMGRGTCVASKCVCNNGYKGIDCSMNK